MRRVAAHWLYLPDGRRIHYPVVEIEGDSVVNYYPLEDELPVTEWLGGIMILSPLAQLSISPEGTFEDILKKLHPEKKITYPLYCWYVNNIDLETKSFISRRQVTLVKTED